MRPHPALLTVLLLGASPPASAQMDRYAVIVGNNVGARDEARLRFAETDASKVYGVLKALGGLRPENAVVLRGESAETVRRAVIAFNARLRGEAGPSGKRPSMLLVYYSGHADAEALHLGQTRLEIRELEQLIRGSAATFRLLIVDACRSGALTRVKGGRLRPPLQITVDRPARGEGVVFLTSSAASEDAQESDRLRGSFFTHYLVSGLVGAADENGDGEVVLDEAYRHAYESTLRASSRTLAGTQHPTYHYDLRGHGQIPLTRLDRDARRARLIFPAGHGFLVMRDHAEGPVVAEVVLHSPRREISVKAGAYFIRARGREALLEGTIALRAGARHAVRPDELERIAYARLVRKGQGEKRLAHGPQLGYRLRTPLANEDAPCHGLFFGYALQTRHLNFVPRVGLCRSSFEAAALSATVDELEVELRVSHAWDLPYLTIEVGVAGGAGVLRQSFDGARVAPSRTTAAGQVGGIAGLSLDLTRGFYLAADVAAQTYFFRHRDSGADDETLTTSFAVRSTFGLGKLW